MERRTFGQWEWLYQIDLEHADLSVPHDDLIEVFLFRSEDELKKEQVESLRKYKKPRLDDIS